MYIWATSHFLHKMSNNKCLLTSTPWRTRQGNIACEPKCNGPNNTGAGYCHNDVTDVTWQMLHGARCCNARGAVILLGYKYTHRSLGPTICVIQTYALRLTSADISPTFSLSTPKLHEATHKMRQQWFYDNENHWPIPKAQFRYCKQH